MTPAERARRKAVSTAAVILGLIWCGALAFRLTSPRVVLPADVVWNQVMTNVRIPAFTMAAGFLAWSGTGWPAVTTCLVAAAAIGVGTRRWRPALFVFLTSVVSVADTALMKQIAARVRPDPVHFASAMSFPSGHTANAAALAVSLALIARRRLIWVTVIAYIALMASSRTYLHAHWISDVVAGAAAGTVTAVLLYGVLRLSRRTRQAVVAPGGDARPADDVGRRPSAPRRTFRTEFDMAPRGLLAWSG